MAVTLMAKAIMEKTLTTMIILAHGFPNVGILFEEDVGILFEEDVGILFEEDVGMLFEEVVAAKGGFLFYINVVRAELI
jgi:hypothetical protein